MHHKVHNPLWEKCSAEEIKASSLGGLCIEANSSNQMSPWLLCKQFLSQMCFLVCKSLCADFCVQNTA